MYSTCIVCNHGLGANEALEHFPVGRQLAFDASRGRLWVVCPHCGRWNLSPLEERWEAIEDAERLFRATRLRVSTENIGLARVREGLELIRIGKPLRPEMAAWRYGRMFADRRKRLLLDGGAFAGLLAAGALILPATTMPLLAPVTIAAAFTFGLAKLTGSSRIFMPKWVRDNAGDYLLLKQDALQFTRLVPIGEDRWGIKVAYSGKRPEAVLHIADYINLGAKGEVTLHGNEALAAARQLLPLINSDGGRQRTVQDAVSLISEWADAPSGFAWAAKRTHQWAKEQQFGDTGALSFLPTEVRLALEMTAFEDQERLALEGELADLERAWREAEEVAAIADDLLIPNPVRRALNRLRGATPP